MIHFVKKSKKQKANKTLLRNISYDEQMNDVFAQIY